MSIEFIPVNPLRTSTGALAALVGVLGEQGAQPTPLDPKATSSFSVVNQTLSMSVASSMGYGSIFKGSASVNDRAFYLDAMAYTDQYAEAGNSGAGIVATRWGIGIRILLRATVFDASLDLNFALVGAAVKLGKAQASYEIDGIGLGLDGLTIVLGDIPEIGEFTYESYLALTKGITGDLGKYIKKNSASLPPQPIAVALATPLDPISEARSNVFAMICLQKGRSLNDALSRGGIWVERDVVNAVYAEIGKVHSPAESPSDDARRAANEWLNTGA